MKTFKEFIVINEEIDESIKKELVCKNISRLLGPNIYDKYIRKVVQKGQGENSVLVVYMQNGDIIELTPSIKHVFTKKILVK